MKEIIASYIPIANMIAKTIGDDCEVVIHDLEFPEKSVVYTVNNRITQRMVGQGFNHLVPEVMMSKQLEDDYIANYYFTTKKGVLIKSSTALIKHEGKVIGAMCINIDTTKIKQQHDWISAMLPELEDKYSLTDEEKKAQHISDIVYEMIEKVTADVDIQNLSRKEKIQIINEFEKQGIFLMKGAIDRVGAIMGISKVTIYSYIDELKGK